MHVIWNWNIPLAFVYAKVLQCDTLFDIGFKLPRYAYIALNTRKTFIPFKWCVRKIHIDRTTTTTEAPMKKMKLGFRIIYTTKASQNTIHFVILWRWYHKWNRTIFRTLAKHQSRFMCDFSVCSARFVGSTKTSKSTRSGTSKTLFRYSAFEAAATPNGRNTTKCHSLWNLADKFWAMENHWIALKFV